MKVCFEIHIEEDRTCAMNISATPTIDSAAFGARSSKSGSDKHNGKPIPVWEQCKKQWHTKEQCWKLHGRLPRGKKRPSNDKQNTRRAYVSDSAESPQQSNPHKNQIDPSSATLGAIVQSGIPHSFGLINVDEKNP